MKLNNIKATLLIFMGLSATSCLDLDPQDQLGGGNMWQDVNQFELFSNQFYGWTRTYNTMVYGDGPFSDQHSDLITSNVKDVFSNGTNTIPTADANYTDNYNHIRRTNLLIENAKSFSRPESVAKYVAEAKFFRAYCYFDLVQMYGDVAITKTPLASNSPEVTSPRNPRGEVVDFILQDLREAIPDLPLASEMNTTQDGRIARGAAQALIARVALYEGTWQKFRGQTQRGNELLDIAAKTAQDVMNSQQYSLFKPATLGTTAYKYLFILENEKSNPAGLKKSDNKEYILSRRYDQTLQPTGLNITHHVQANVQWVTAKMANMYLTKNGTPIDQSNAANYAQMSSEFQNRDNRMSSTLMVAGGTYWSDNNPRVSWDGGPADVANAMTTDFNPAIYSGYHNQKWATERNVPERFESYDFPVLRYAEVLLNYAEAVFERDGEIKDTDLDISLNLVRNRVNPDMPKLTNGFVVANNLDMRTEIRRERTVEFFNEGFRLNDLKRWKTAETEMQQDLLGIKWTGTEFQTKWTDASSYNKNSDGRIVLETGRKWEQKNYLLPLPADQVQLNPLLGQNW